MAIVIEKAYQDQTNPRQIIIVSTGGNVFKKIRINEAYENSAAMAEKLVGQTVRNEKLWKFTHQAAPKVEPPATDDLWPDDDIPF